MNASLNVNLQAAHGGEGVAHAFPHRGVRVNHVHHIVDGAFEMEHGGGLGQNLRGQRANNVDAQHFAVFFIGDHFDEAAVISENGGLAVADERKLAGLDGVARGDGFFLGEADGTDLRLAVGGVGNARAQKRFGGLPGDVRHRDDALHHGGVGELWHSGDDVPDGVQPWFVGFAVRADVDEAAIELGLGFFQTAIFRHGLAADGQQQLLGLQGLRFAVFVLEADGYARGVFLDGVNFAAGEDLNIFLAEGFVEFHGNLFVFDGNHAVEGFDDGHLRAEGVVDGGKLHAHGARTHDDQGFGNGGKFEDGAIGENGLVVRLNAGKGARFRAADQQHVGGFDDGGLAVFFDADFAGTCIASPALHKFHLIFLEQKLDALGMLFDDFVFARQDVGPIHVQAADFEAQFGAIFEVIVNFRVVQQHLGGNAANVQTGAAKIGVFLHDHGLQS